MKYTSIIMLLCGLALTACNTNKRLYEAQQYDELIQKASKEICHGQRYDTDDFVMLSNAYHRSNQADHERIMSLKATGDPAVWPEVFQRYKSMKGRNDALRCLKPKMKREMDYVRLDLDDELAVSRSKAESYLLAKINILLDSRSKDDALEAQRLIAQLGKVSPDNSHLQDCRLRALLHASENILVKYVDDFDSPMPEGFAEEVVRFDADELAKSRSNIYLSKHRDVDYDLTVKIVIRELSAQPDRTESVTFDDSTKEGEKALVTDYTQSKQVAVKGWIAYHDFRSGREILVSPFEVTSSFKHDYTTVKGNSEVCSEATRSRLQSKAVPFPTEGSLFIDAAKRLNDLVAAELIK